MLEWLWNIQKRVSNQPGGRYLSHWSISEDSSPFAVPAAFDWILHADGTDREQLARVLAGLMRKAQPQEWVHLYPEFKTTKIRPADVATLARLDPDTAVEMLGVATLNGGGYTREAALKAMGSLGHPRAVPYVLLRLGDWVFEVHEAAWKALRSLMNGEIAEELIQHYALIDRLNDVQRIGLQATIDEITAYLRADKARPVVREALRSKKPSLRLFGYRLLEGELTAELISQAACDPAPSVRAWLVRWLVRSDHRDCPDLVARLLHDASSCISTMMIGSLPGDQIAEYRDRLLELAFSDTQAVRHAARFAALQAGPFDFAAEARKQILAGLPETIRPGVVASLGETGAASDFALVRPFLQAGRSRLRKAAVEACMRLGKDQAVECVIPLLNDATRGVRLTVTRMLAGGDLQAWYPRLREILRSGSAGGQRQALELLILQGGWEAVPEMLCGLSSEHESVRRYAWWSIDAWFCSYRLKGWLKASETVRSALRREMSRLQDRPNEFGVSGTTHWDEMQRWIARETQGATD